MSEREYIIQTALRLGASEAGIAGIEALKSSLSYAVYDRSPYYEGYTGIVWPETAGSVLVLALCHDPADPGLDWWSEDIPGRTPGNGILRRISKKLRKVLWEEREITAEPLPYPIERGGIFLKDAAVLAGLGVIGKNNLFISRIYGPRVRLRALFLDRAVQAGTAATASPCDGCSMPCHQACPERAFRNGSYVVALCEPEMQRNRTTTFSVEGASVRMAETCSVNKFCRACELACPVGKSLHSS